MVATRTMATFTSSTALEHIVNNILGAGEAKAPFRQAIHAAGAQVLTDFMMIDVNDFKSLELEITTDQNSITKKLNVVQQRKLMALQAWGRKDGQLRGEDEWRAFTAAEFKTYLELHTAGSATTSVATTTQAPNKKKTVEEKAFQLLRMKTEDKIGD